MKLYLWIGSVGLVLFGLWAFHGWAYRSGEAACQLRHETAAREAQAAALTAATAQNRADAALGVAAAEAVEGVRAETAARLDRVLTQPLPIPEAPHALDCPDPLAEPWLRLFDEPGGGEPHPAAEGAAR